MNPKIAPIIDNIAINEFPCIPQLSRNRNNDPESKGPEGHEIAPKGD